MVSPFISFYEFTDGEIDAGKYDNNTYTYQIKLKFRDPLIEYLTDRLVQAKTIIKDLDELLYKSELKIKDNTLGKYVNVYDIYKKQQSINTDIHIKEYSKNYTYNVRGRNLREVTQ